MAQQHTEEFRSEAVRLALTSGLSRKQVAARDWIFNIKPLDMAS